MAVVLLQALKTEIKAKEIDSAKSPITVVKKHSI
jgi:hypothetical protein